MTKVFGFDAEFFDIFGLATFTFLFVVALRSYLSGVIMENWILWIIMIIGILGFIVDGGIVLKRWFGGKK